MQVYFLTCLILIRFRDIDANMLLSIVSSSSYRAIAPIENLTADRHSDWNRS
ncbi:hypothetical protein [Chamaesiphon sp. GL140_3_metabinner_50]|uniref:hypothetical protein n=1 Tax=Chamaesiphon sp. GL140_3_metabinner_50 TaxID=2970812 RepID=UPI0025E93970|nr:hypothetical protein [Chamaesiphon sp. GL140_3_metabinner_50]